MGTGRPGDHIDDRDEPRPGGHGILQELEPCHSGRELLRGNPRTDDDRREKSCAEKLGNERAEAYRGSQGAVGIAVSSRVKPLMNPKDQVPHNDHRSGSPSGRSLRRLPAPW